MVHSMLTAEDLQAIKDILREETNPINGRLDTIENRLDTVDKRLDTVDKRLDMIETDIAVMKDDIEQLKEDTEITRDVTNSIGEWIDFYFKEDRPYPIPDNARKLG